MPHNRGIAPLSYRLPKHTMQPLGKEQQHALSRSVEKAQRKAGKAKGRQEDRKLCREGREESN